MGDVLVRIGENAIAIGTVRFPNPDGRVRVGWWLGRPLVTGIMSGSGREVAGGDADAANFVVFLVLFRLSILWLLSGTTLLAGRCVSVFVFLEAVFKLLNSFVLGGVLLAKKRILSEKSEISLGKDRPTAERIDGSFDLDDLSGPESTISARSSCSSLGATISAWLFHQTDTGNL